MRAVCPAQRPLPLAAMVSAAMLLSSCGGGSSSSPGVPSAGEPTLPAGAIRVTGSERLAWQQAGDVGNLRFVAYVDGNQVRLDQAQCDGAAPEAACSSPLPPLADGLRTLAVAAITRDGDIEGERSESLSLQKVSARSVISAAQLPDARASGVGIAPTFTTPDGGTWVADVVARDVASSAQLAALPDGRVLVAAGARVLAVRAGESPVLALDLRALLGDGVGPASLAVHPEFARNGLVFAAFLASDDPERTRVRLVRLRDSGNALGEPATIADVPLTPAARIRGGDGALASSGAPAPRVAVAADGLLHLLVPAEWQVDDPRLASHPVGALARMTLEGGVPERGPVAGMVAHPVGFTSLTAGGAWLALVPAGADTVAVRFSGNAATAPVSSAAGAWDRATGTVHLAVDDGPVRDLATLMAASAGREPVTVRLATAVSLDGVVPGVSATLYDLVGDQDGTVYALVGDGGAAAAGGDSAVIVRLRRR